MNSKDAVRLAIKLVGLAIFLFGVIQAASSFPILISAFEDDAFGRYSAPLIITFIMPTLLGLFLWLFPSIVASTVIQSEFNSNTTNELLIGLEGIAIRVLGFYFLYVCLSSFLSTYVGYNQAIEQNGFDAMFNGRKNYYLMFVTQGIEFIMSLFLILGAKTIVRFIRKLKYAS